MNRQEYLEQLRKNNGDCVCLPLAVLYNKKDKAQHLEKKCDSLAMEVDLDNPGPNNSLKLQLYRKKAEQLQNAIGNYHLEITDLIAEGDLNVFYHNSKDKSRNQISSKDLQKRLNENELITINCSFCNQQVDILSSP